MITEILQRPKITRPTLIVCAGSGLLAILSLVIGAMVEIDDVAWFSTLITWTLALWLYLWIVLIFSMVYLVRLRYIQRSWAGAAGNGLGLLVSIFLLIGVLSALHWVADRAQAVQFDRVQNFCRMGFEDPAVLEEYRGSPRAVGRWDHVLVWEDETHNAIWLDTCNSLSSCGILCVRDGILLENAVKNSGYEFSMIRDGLYWWH